MFDKVLGTESVVAAISRQKVLRVRVFGRGGVELKPRQCLAGEFKQEG